MNTFKQLLRQPVRTAAALLLLCLSTAFFSMASGMLVSSQATTDAIDRRFVTVAVPTNEYAETKRPDGSVSFEPLFTYEMAQLINELPNTCPAIRGRYNHGFISAFSPELDMALSSRNGERYQPLQDSHYNGVVLDVTLTEVGEGSQYVTCWAKVNGAVVMHPELKLREKLKIDFSFDSEDELAAARLRVGGRYLICSDNYTDEELLLKKTVAGIVNCSVDEVDWNNIDLLDPEEYGLLPDGRTQVASYRDDELGVGMSMVQDDLDSIGACSVMVQNMSGYYLEQFNSPDAPDYLKYPDMIDGSVGTVPYYEIYKAPTVTPLDDGTDLDAFLASEAGREWAYYIEQLETRQHCVPVIGTDLLESIYPFRRMSAFVVAGRTFSDADYAHGNRVCIISELTAQGSGLTVGDTIDMSFYWGAEYIEGGNTAGGLNDVVAQPYYSKLGFSGEEQGYEIIGLYRQSDPWDTSETIHFNPNAVFVPNASIGQPYYEGDTGIYCTLVLKNGGVDEVKQAIADAGYQENILLYFDGGYGEMQDTLRGFNESALQLFAVSCAALIAVMAVYLALFVFRQQRTIGLMISLGAGKAGACGFAWRFTMLPVLVSAVIGGAAGALFLQSALHRAFATVSEAFGSSFGGAVDAGTTLEGMLTATPWASVCAAAAFAVLFAAVIWLCTVGISRKSLLKLLKK